MHTDTSQLSDMSYCVSQGNIWQIISGPVCEQNQENQWILTVKTMDHPMFSAFENLSLGAIRFNGWSSLE